MNNVSALREAGNHYLDLGLCALPANRETKYPLGKWKQYQYAMPVNLDWMGADAVCVLTGKISGGLELLDFDFEADRYDAWQRLVQAEAPWLFDRLVIETSQTGGKHVFYRCSAVENDGSQKLAWRYLEREQPGDFIYKRKTVTARKAGGKCGAKICLIETKAEGGLAICAPSPGYELTQGSFDNVPVISPDERAFLLDVARSLNEVRKEERPEPAKQSKPNGSSQSEKPGEDFNLRGDFKALLEAEGWEHVRTDGENELWRRPGKTGFNWSASIKGRQFYVFSSNAAPFESETCYSPFGVYAHLKHNGDFAAAARALREQGYGAELEKSTRKYDESEYNPRFDQYAVANLDEPFHSANADPTFGPSNEPRTKIAYKTITAAELARGKYDIEFLIEDCLVAGQPLVLAGGKKCLKTNNMLDAAISLVTGSPFLGTFRVNRTVNVGVMSGESGMGTIQETCLRICQAKGLDLETDCEGLVFTEDLPRIGDPDHHEALRQWIEHFKVELLVLDPAYLCMPADDNANLFAQGELLRQLTSVCGNAGAGIIVAHHTKKRIADPYQPAELEDISWAGWQEFARQWWLLSRQCKYDPERCGHHELWLNIGGSAGHSSLWGVTIDEGSRKDQGGRRWQVQVLSASQAREEGMGRVEATKQETSAKKWQAKVEAAKEGIAAAFRSIPSNCDTRSQIEERSGCKGKAFTEAWGILLREGKVKEAEVTRGNGQKYPGYRYEFGKEE
jgi:hypothetical protein